MVEAAQDMMHRLTNMGRDDFFFYVIYRIGRGKRNIMLKIKVGIGFGKMAEIIPPSPSHIPLLRLYFCSLL